jgi:hypothetical protein
LLWATIVGRRCPYAHQHELHAFCPRCEGWSVIDLKVMM